MCVCVCAGNCVWPVWVSVPEVPPPATATSPISQVYLETPFSPKGAHLASQPRPGWRVLPAHLLGQLPLYGPGQTLCHLREGHSCPPHRLPLQAQLVSRAASLPASSQPQPFAG